MLRRIASLSLFALAHCSSAEPTPGTSRDDHARTPLPRDARAPTPSERPAPPVDASPGPADDADGIDPGAEPVGRSAFLAVTDVSTACPCKTKSYSNWGPTGTTSSISRTRSDPTGWRTRS
jgi:hypothetical protein